MMRELAIRVVVFVGVATFMGSVSNSLQRIANDLRILAGRSSSKSPEEDPGRLIDA